MKTKLCPICDGSIEIYDDLDVGDDVYCDECDREFVLTGFDPIVMELNNSYDDLEDFYLDEDEY